MASGVAGYALLNRCVWTPRSRRRALCRALRSAKALRLSDRGARSSPYNLFGRRVRQETVATRVLRPSLRSLASPR